jgi:endogenous inhibitor of DNA gyrase (YacG/DUF329 family)
MTQCPICLGSVHAANRSRYRGACSDPCDRVMDAREDRDEARAMAERAGAVIGQALGHLRYDDLDQARAVLVGFVEALKAEQAAQ